MSYCDRWWKDKAIKWLGNYLFLVKWLELIKYLENSDEKRFVFLYNKNCRLHLLLDIFTKL